MCFGGFKSDMVLAGFMSFTACGVGTRWNSSGVRTNHERLEWYVNEDE